MAINLIGIPLLVLFLASLIGTIVGIVSKNKKVILISVIVLAVVILLYAVFFVVYH
jgi:hypothetical protein